MQINVEMPSHYSLSCDMLFLVEFRVLDVILDGISSKVRDQVRWWQMREQVANYLRES